MDNHKKRIRRTILDILLELVGLAVLTVFLWNIQTVAAVRHQESNSTTKLDIAQQRMEQNAAEAKDNLTTYDAFSQAKVDTVAFCLARDPETADLSALCSQWGLQSYYLLDASGRVTAASVPAAQRDVSIFADALKTMDAATLSDGLRYYFSPMADGGVLIGSRDVTEEDALIAELCSPVHALSTIKVGTTGYIFAVDETTGVLAYHPDRFLLGRSAASEGLDPARFPAGYDDWITLNGEKYYCMTRSVKDYLMAAIVPESELMASAGRTTSLSVLIFAVVISLLVIYALILRRDQDKHPTRATDYRKVGRLYFDRIVAGKIRNVALVGLLAVFLVTLYVQTLSALSRQSLVSDTKLASVETLLETNSTRVDELTEEYNIEYTQRAKNIAWTLAQDPTLVDDDALAALAEKAQIRAIYVFDKKGRTVATNTNFKDFVLSSDEGDQSYPFWNVVKGYVDEYAQPIMQDDTALHQYIQYVGVKRLDADGMVQLGMMPRRMENRLRTTTLSYVLSNIAVENDGMLFAVDPSDGTFLSYPKERYIGRSAAQYGLTATALVDGYTGDQTIDGTTYFVTSMQWEDTVVCIAVPHSTIYAQRVSTSVAAAVISLIIILLMSAFLIFSGKPTEDTAQDRAEEKAQSAKFFRMFQDNGRTRVVQSAASRWNGTHLAWHDRTPEQKLIYLTGLIVGAGVLALVCSLWLLGDAMGRGSIISYILSQKWEKGLNLFSLTYVGIILLEVMTITVIVRRVLTFVLSRFGARSETIGRLLDSFIKYMSIIGVVFYGLSVIGVDSTTLITSAGILSLGLSLGAQSLVGDIIAGIFIVFEGEFRVGDIVTIGDWRGTVLEIGIRTTKIESAGKDIKIFNNSAISGVINMTKQYSFAFVDVGIEYGESLERVEAVLQKELPVMKEHLPAIVNGPFYKGVAALSDSSVNIRIVAQCQEKDRMQLVRDMNREMKLIFDKHNINIPFPQIVLNQPAEHEQATRNEIKAAKAFVEEQKELTKDIHVRDEEN